MQRFELNINGARTGVMAEEGTPLLWVLRDHLGLTGTKFGCGVGQCGACTVHVDGLARRSCLVRIEQVERRSVVTIEGLGVPGPHPVQVAWIQAQVPQCGYCQSGQIMAAAALLARNAAPTDADIDRALRGHICRCGTYARIRRAVKQAAKIEASTEGERR